MNGMTANVNNPDNASAVDYPARGSVDFPSDVQVEDVAVTLTNSEIAAAMIDNEPASDDLVEILANVIALCETETVLDVLELLKELRLAVPLAARKAAAMEARRMLERGEV